MLYEDVKAMGYRLNELYNQHDIAALATLHAPDFKMHSSTFPGGTTDIEGWKATMAMFWQAFPDLRNDIQDMIIEGDTVVLRLAYTATHLGEFQGIPPTGKQYTMLTGIDISRYENGLVKEEWLEINMLPMLQAMGAIPGTPPA